MRFEEEEEFALGKELLAILFHDFVDALGLRSANARHGFGVVVMLGSYLVGKRYAACKAHGVKCIGAFLCIGFALGHNIIHFGQAN